MHQQLLHDQIFDGFFFVVPSRMRSSLIEGISAQRICHGVVRAGITLHCYGKPDLSWQLKFYLRRHKIRKVLYETGIFFGPTKLYRGHPDLPYPRSLLRIFSYDRESSHDSLWAFLQDLIERYRLEKLSSS